MKKIIGIFFLLAIGTTQFLAQSLYTEEFGKVTQNEMDMASYDGDKDAEAVVIYEIGNYYFRGEERKGFLLNMTKKIKIKILKSSGVKFANFEIPYFNGDEGWEYIDDIEATTYNWENNQLTKSKLDSKNIFEEKINDNIRLKKIALSDVREGSVIELRYKIATPYFFNMRKWEFQKEIPVLHSLLQYRAIPYFEYTYIMRGTREFDEFKATPKSDEIRFGQYVYKELLYDFGIKDIPAFKDEEFITSEKDYMISLNFQMSKIFYANGGSRDIVTTWPQMSDDLLQHDNFGKYIKNSEKEATKILPTLDLANKTPQAQMQEITEYVKSTYNWNGYYDKYSEGKVSDFFKNKTQSLQQKRVM